jgi:hypothetical protein
VTRRLLVLPILAMLVAVPFLVADSAPARASHSWGSYHWARTSNPFTLKVGDNVSGTWDGHLNTAISDWNDSDVLQLQNVSGQAKSKNCRATAGQVEVCNGSYGLNGWLGIAQVWISGSHITQAVAKVNDSYFSRSPYNTSAWRQLVMCQEIAHDFGLDHQDEDFDNSNLGTCMDYTSNPASNQHPNAHDFEQLVSIYKHPDSSTTVRQTTENAGPGRSGTAADEGPNNPADFGRPTGDKDGYGRDHLFVKDVPGGRKLFTHVFWALPNSAPGAPGRR